MRGGRDTFVFFASPLLQGVSLFYSQHHALEEIIHQPFGTILAKLFSCCPHLNETSIKIKFRKDYVCVYIYITLPEQKDCLAL